jgi:hypothetical protein
VGALIGGGAGYAGASWAAGKIYDTITEKEYHELPAAGPDEKGSYEE